MATELYLLYILLIVLGLAASARPANAPDKKSAAPRSGDGQSL